MQKQFLMNLDNAHDVYEHATMGNFLNHMIDYPGGINQDMVFNVWLQNPLKNGIIQLKDKVYYLLCAQSVWTEVIGETLSLSLGLPIVIV